MDLFHVTHLHGSKVRTRLPLLVFPVWSDVKNRNKNVSVEKVSYFLRGYLLNPVLGRNIIIAKKLIFLIDSTIFYIFPTH